MCPSAEVASAIRACKAFAVSAIRLMLTGRSPLVKRRMARSSIPRRREAEVAPPSTWMQWAKCSVRSCVSDDTVVGLSLLGAIVLGTRDRDSEIASRLITGWIVTVTQEQDPSLTRAQRRLLRRIYNARSVPIVVNHTPLLTFKEANRYVLSLATEARDAACAERKTQAKIASS